MNDCLSSFLWARGTTLEQLAKEARVDAWTISCWGKGERNPQSGKLRRVALILGLKDGELRAMLEAEANVKDECLALRRSRECRSFLQLVRRGRLDAGPATKRLLKRLQNQRRDLDRACAALEKRLSAAAGNSASTTSQATTRKPLLRLKRKRKPRSVERVPKRLILPSAHVANCEGCS
jgi:hypothetical protein